MGKMVRLTWATFVLLPTFLQFTQASPSFKKFGDTTTFFVMKFEVLPTEKQILICGMPKVGITELRSGLAFTVKSPSSWPPTESWPSSLNAQVVTSVIIRNPFARFYSWYRSKILIDITFGSRKFIQRTIDHEEIYHRQLLQKNKVKQSKPKKRKSSDNELFTGNWNVLLLDASSIKNTTVYPPEVYAKAILNKQLKHQNKVVSSSRSSSSFLDPHITPQVELCHIGLKKYDVIGQMEDLNQYIHLLKEVSGLPTYRQIVIHNQKLAPTNIESSIEKLQLLYQKQYDIMKNSFHNFKWSHKHINHGGELWQTHLSCEAKQLIAQVYKVDFDTFNQLGFNYSQSFDGC